MKCLRRSRQIGQATHCGHSPLIYRGFHRSGCSRSLAIYVSIGRRQGGVLASTMRTSCEPEQTMHIVRLTEGAGPWRVSPEAQERNHGKGEKTNGTGGTEARG